MNIEQTLKEKLLKVLTSQGLSLSVSDIEITNTKDKKFGDYASNAALKFAGRISKKPQELASIIRNEIDYEGIEKIEIAGPGFINFFLKNEALNSIVEKILNEKDNYGRGENKNKKINVQINNRWSWR